MGILDQAVIPIKKENTMKQFIKKIFGGKEPEPVVEKAAPVVLSPKEKATANKEPWVAVLDTHVNKDNIRNGFFELDWNEYFVLQLRASGYNGENDEAIVDQWFSELCRNVGAEEGVNMDRRGAGYINVNNLGNGRTEVS
jgi:hypothetical protein